MLRKLFTKVEGKAIQMKSQLKSFLTQKSGEGLFTDIILVVVIVAVVGAIVYGIIQLFFPDIITGVMEKVQGGIDGIDMFDGN